MKVKRTYGKQRSAELEVPTKDSTFDRLLFGEENSASKAGIKPNIRASFNRDSSLDETKAKLKSKQKKVRKTKHKPKDENSSYDEIYESFMREKKKRQSENKLKKQTEKKKRLVSLQSVKVSTPLSEELRKRKADLVFGISPIVQNAKSGILSEAFFDSLKRKRLLEIEALQKKLETTAIREAKELIAQYETRKPLQSTENIVAKDQSTKTETSRFPLVAKETAPLKTSEKEEKKTEKLPKRRNRRSALTRRKISEFFNEVDSTPPIKNTKQHIAVRNKRKAPLSPPHMIESENEANLSPKRLLRSSQQSISIILVSPPKSIDNSLTSPLKIFNVPDDDSYTDQKLPKPPKKNLEATKSSRASRRQSKLRLATVECDYKKEIPVIRENESSRKIVKKSVGINLIPEVRVIENGASPAKETSKLSLQPGKWRRSLISWRQTQSNQFEDVQQERKSHRSTHYQPQLVTLEESVLLEQSDEGNLQTALSILDSSIKCATTFHEQRKTSQRKTSVFQRSSIFYGLQEQVIDVAPSLSARQIALRRCGQQEPLPFNEVYSESQLPNCCKIGEGVYGEVFMYKCPTTNKPIVLKIIPIEGDQLINGESQKRFDEILQEIVISMELSGLRHGLDYSTDGFVNVKRVTCIRGAYPEHLIDEWELYRDNRSEGSDNDHPAVFLNDQLYVVFELCNGGKDLESFVFNNAEEAQSVFLQTALTLAVAEGKYEFEHRDLHWGNLLIAATEDKFSEYRIAGKLFKVLNHGVKVTIIDYSLSRMVYDGAVLYDNLARDEELFESQGDYQFDIYRLMRARVENNFALYEPFSNLLWLHYIVDKLINGARYRHSKTKKHRAAIHDLMEERDELLNYTSATNYVSTLDF